MVCVLVFCVCVFFFFKQKTAYEMRIGDWSADVCSSDLSPPGEVAGSFVFGSEGAIIFIMFDNRSGMVPKFADANDQANFDEHFRKDVEAVATGQFEKTVAILPLRDTYTRGRAVVCNTMEEAEEYRRQTGTEW